MKKICLLFVFSVISSFASAQAILQCSFESVLTQVSDLENFQPLTQSEIHQVIGFDIGKCRGTIHGNSTHRDKVLDILSCLPNNYLYRENRLDEDKWLSRYYICTNDDEKYKMLYVFVGIGGNDLVVILFEDGNLTKYQELANREKL